MIDGDQTLLLHAAGRLGSLLCAPDSIHAKAGPRRDLEEMPRRKSCISHNCAVYRAARRGKRAQLLILPWRNRGRALPGRVAALRAPSASSGWCAGCGTASGRRRPTGTAVARATFPPPHARHTASGTRGARPTGRKYWAAGHRTLARTRMYVPTCTYSWWSCFSCFATDIQVDTAVRPTTGRAPKSEIFFHSSREPRPAPRTRTALHCGRTVVRNRTLPTSAPANESGPRTDGVVLLGQLVLEGGAALARGRREAARAHTEDRRHGSGWVGVSLPAQRQSKTRRARSARQRPLPRRSIAAGGTAAAQEGHRGSGVAGAHPKEKADGRNRVLTQF